MTRAAVYSRKSSRDDRDERDSSVGRQVELAKAFASERGWTVPDELVFTDNEVSATSWRERTGWKALRAAAAYGQFQKLIVMAASRISRDQTRGPAEIAALEDDGVEIVAYQSGRRISFNDEGGDETAILATTIDGIVDSGHVRNTKRLTKEALQSRATRGHATGYIGFGFTTTKVGTSRKGHDHVEIAVDPEQKAVIIRIFEMAAAGQGLAVIARTLREESVPAPTKGGWRKASVRELLHADRIVGRFVYGKERRKRKGDKIVKVPVPQSEWIVTEREDLRIVPAELHAAAHKALAGRRRAQLGFSGRQPTPDGAPAGSYALSGLLRCAGCGLTLTADLRRRDCGLVKAFVCPAYRRGVKCSTPTSIPLDHALMGVVNALTESLTKDRLAEWVRDICSPKTADRLAQDRKRVAAELGKVEQAIQKLLDAIEAGGAVAGRLQEREVEQRRLKQTLADLDDQVAATTADGENLRNVIDAIASIGAQGWQGLLAAHPERARKMVAGIVPGGFTVTKTKLPRTTHRGRQRVWWTLTATATLGGLAKVVEGQAGAFPRWVRIEPREPQADETSVDAAVSVARRRAGSRPRDVAEVRSSSTLPA